MRFLVPISWLMIALALPARADNTNNASALPTAPPARCSVDIFRELLDMIARTAFTQLNYSALRLMGTLLGLLLAFVAPVVLALSTNPKVWLAALLAWCLMSASFLPTVVFYRLSPIWSPFLPIAAVFYTYATLLSAMRFWRGRGGQWKGRAQAQKT